jgi:diguanylate cyclase (GGDEF)-like protein
MNLALESATTLAEGLSRLAGRRMQVVLLDLSLPDSTGLRTLARVREEAPDVAVVVLTGEGDPAYATQALQEGAQDYLLKHETDERSLVRSLRYAMERQRLLGALASLSLTDDLTRLQNRRGFFTLAERQWTLAERQGTGLSLVFADLDGLKDINDRFGHQEGDRALMTTARLLMDVCREADIPARLGGDEFGVMLVDADERTGPGVVERLDQSVRHLNCQHQHPYVLSFSVGLAHHSAGCGGSLDMLVAEADANMYECKRLRQTIRLRRA